MKVSTVRSAILFLFVSVAGWSCSGNQVDHWIDAVPQSTPALFVMDANTSVEQVLNTQLGTLAAQASNTNNAEILRLVSEISGSALSIQAMAVIPANSDEWKPVWILNAPKGTAERASELYSRPQTANGYNFQGNRIFTLFLGDSMMLYALQSGSYMFVAESSLALESFARTISGNESSLNVGRSELKSGQWFLNFTHLDDFIATETAVRYRPVVFDAFKGAGIARLNTESTSTHVRVTGNLELDSANRSNLVQALSNSNHRTLLDRYVSEDVAMAAFFYGKAPNLPALNSPVELDIFLTTRENERERFNSAIGSHVALVAFGSSGYLGASEYAYVRQVERADQLRSTLDAWTSQGMAQREGDRYIVDSIVLSWLISGGLTQMGVFHLSFDNDILVATQRPALITKLITDKERRRTLYFTETYLNARATFPDVLSAFIYTRNESLNLFLQPLLNTTQSTGLILDQFDIGAVAVQLNPDSRSLRLEFSSYEVKQTSQPYDDRWLVRLDGTDLAGYPVLADIAGSSREEILVSTQGGTVAAIAADGTIVFRVSTGIDTPVGSPIAYDWYANNQMAVIQGAGNKIYGWSNNGSPLPGFPILLSETLSAPIVITDITRNGIAEIVAATSDRQLHVLNQRGQNINGWPQSLNASIRVKPTVSNWMGSNSIIAYSENVLFAFDTNGVVKAGFPMFNRSPLRGDVTLHNDYLIIGSADGTVLSIGRGTLFPTGNAPIISPPSQSGGDITVQGLRLADSGIMVRPQVSTHTIRLDETNVVTEPVIFIVTDQGSLFAVNLRGDLRFSQSLGQPALPDHAPLLADVDRNGQSEIMGIAAFGRMYAWQLNTAERFFNIPTTNLHRPIFADINGNGSNELIAGTQDGLRAWTINR
jgi:hypothetical protein